MYNIQVHNLVNKIIIWYYRLGIWKHEEKTIYYEWGRKLFHLIISVSFFVSLTTGALQSERWNDGIFTAVGSIAVAVNAIKLFYILWKKDQILSFLPSTAVHFMSDSEEFSQINKKLNFFMNFNSIFCAMIYLDAIVCSIVGLPIFSHRKNLPLNIGFPLDWRNNEIGFWMAYAYLMIEIIFHAAYILITVIIWYIMFNCSIKYQILEMQFKNIGNYSRIGMTTDLNTKPRTKRNISEAEKHKFYLLELIELIKTHQSIEEIIKRFKSCFDKLFFAQISTSSICICGTVYTLAFSSGESLYQTIVYVVLTIYNFFDIFMVMFLGNEIKIYSGRLSYALFQSDWTNQSKSCKKCILLLMEVLKQPQELVIGLVYPLNLETFTSILKFAYSTFNILKSFN